MSMRGFRRFLIPALTLLLTASAFAAPAKKPASRTCPNSRRSSTGWSVRPGAGGWRG
jgi:hypothetical protein